MDILLFGGLHSSRTSFHLTFNHGIVSSSGKLCPSLVRISLERLQAVVLSLYSLL